MEGKLEISHFIENYARIGGFRRRRAEMRWLVVKVALGSFKPYFRGLFRTTCRHFFCVLANETSRECTVTGWVWIPFSVLDYSRG